MFLDENNAIQSGSSKSSIAGSFVVVAVIKTFIFGVVYDWDETDNVILVGQRLHIFSYPNGWQSNFLEFPFTFHCFYCYVSLIPSRRPQPFYSIPLHFLQNFPIIMFSVCFSLLHSHIRTWFCLAFLVRGKRKELFVGKIMLGIFHPLLQCKSVG